MLTIYRRHLKSCPQTSRNYRRCHCPIHVEGTLAGEPVRKALDLTSWEAAQTLVREWEATGRITRAIPSVAEALEKFLADARAAPQGGNGSPLPAVPPGPLRAVVQARRPRGL